jgi:hypothetical protein
MKDTVIFLGKLSAALVALALSPILIPLLLAGALVAITYDLLWGN